MLEHRPRLLVRSLIAAACALWWASTALAHDEPLAGYAHGTFFIRSENDDFVLIPHGRLQVDMYGYGRGDNASARLPQQTITLRRGRTELNGTFLKRIDFQISGEWTNGPLGGAQGLNDGWIAVEILPSLRLQFGLHDAPFTLENRTSDKYFDFMERSVTVRSFGVPQNKEVGVWAWGLLPKEAAYYSVGVFNGAGRGVRNPDGRFDTIARAWVAPFVLADAKSFRDVTVGGSFWYASRGQSDVALPDMTTQGGYGFFQSTFRLGGDPSTQVQLFPRRNQWKWAVEADLPFSSRLGLRFELVHQDLGLDEIDPAGASRGRLRLSGTSFYVQAWWYLFGNDDILPRPGLQIPHRVRPIVPDLAPRKALQLVARYERVRFDLAREVALQSDPSPGRYELDLFELGLNYWMTKHVRFTFNYVLNHFGGDAGQLRGALGRPVLGSDYLHEFLARVAVAL